MTHSFQYEEAEYQCEKKNIIKTDKEMSLALDPSLEQ